MLLRTLVLAVALAVVASTAPAAAAPAPDPAALALLRHVIGRINADDVAGLEPDFVSAPAMVDEFPPFVWAGAGAAGRWGHAFDAMAAAAKMSAFHGVLGAATAWTPEGERAYLVIPVTFTFRQNGSPMREIGLWALTLRRSAGAWKIATATWATSAIAPS